jgi:hypothetical protein
MMGGVILPDRKPETIARYDASFFASPIPVKERAVEDQHPEVESLAISLYRASYVKALGEQADAGWGRAPRVDKYYWRKQARERLGYEPPTNTAKPKAPTLGEALAEFRAASTALGRELMNRLAKRTRRCIG